MRGLKQEVKLFLLFWKSIRYLVYFGTFTGNNKLVGSLMFNGTFSTNRLYQAIIIIIISGLHHYECVAPLVANSLQSGRFWARSSASVHDSPWESRSFCTVFIRGRPGGLFQCTEEEVKICFASTLSSIRAICPNRVRRRAWIISVCRGWLLWRRTSSLEMSDTT